MRLSVVMLAAGQGKRMVSDVPKVLHAVGGKAMLAHVLETTSGLGTDQCLVVYGHGGAAVKAAFAAHASIIWVEQAEQLGTGHAVAQALPHIPDDHIVLTLYADVPLVRAATLQPLLECARQHQLGLLTVELDNPTGYGRIIRAATGQVQRIVEEKDASAEQRRIREVNTGILAAPAASLRVWVNSLENNNSQGEYYLTDVIEKAAAETSVQAFAATEVAEVQGVNDRRQLATLERYYQQRQVEKLLTGGATLLDPDRVDVRGTASTGKDVVIDVNVVFEGKVQLGNRVRIGPHSVIRDAILGDDVEVLSHCCIEDVRVGNNVQIGPFARLRPGTQLADGAKVGNFVEIKKAVIGPASKVNHLTYIGDAEIGADVNVGAGTITCNYDGANKHQTIIEDRVFVGSNVALVAPVRVGEGTTIGAGSTISKDVPADSLALTRAPQRVIAGWQRPAKKNSST